MPRRPFGRPMKYDHLIEMLEEDQLYSPATIAAFAKDHGMLNHAGKGLKPLQIQRIRIAMGRLSNNHEFPDEGDGYVKIPGQAHTPAWFGWRWKLVLG